MYIMNIKVHKKKIKLNLNGYNQSTSIVRLFILIKK